MRQVYEAVRKHVSERRGEMISLLEKIVNIDSGTTNIAGVEAVCGILKQEMEAIGMDVRVIPSEGAGPVLVGGGASAAGNGRLLSWGTWARVLRAGRRGVIRSESTKTGWSPAPGCWVWMEGWVSRRPPSGRRGMSA